ncbi:hypothetical protein [Streptosporangium sp. KLBMP 9127]|nr:hypothetical protein [Streptosporangium sp. KLBMP 9127]
MVAVQDGFDAREIWPFQCLSCRHIWEAEYVVRHRGDGHGNETDLWLRNGVPVQPPWAESHCPDCDAFSIAVFPIGYLTRPQRSGVHAGGDADSLA